MIAQCDQIEASALAALQEVEDEIESTEDKKADRGSDSSSSAG